MERPLLRFDETMPVLAGEYFAVHPGFSSAQSYSLICDNYPR